MIDTRQCEQMLDKANEELFAIQKGKKKFLTRKEKKAAIAKLIERIRVIMDTQLDAELQNSREAMEKARNVKL